MKWKNSHWQFGIIFLFVFLLLGVGLWIASNAKPAVPADASLRVCFDSNCWRVEVARTPEEAARGLMFRSELPAGRGMLFVFENEAARVFWMKNVSFPLDLVWMNQDLEVVGVTLAVPPCARDPCPRFASPAPVKFVLEVNAGEASGLKLGAKAQWT